MGRRRASSQFHDLKRGSVGKQKAKDEEKWRGQFATRAEVDRMLQFYLDQYDRARFPHLYVEPEPVEPAFVEGAPDAGA